MKAFRFSLERIRRFRERRERAWEIKLAGATRPCVELNRRIEGSSKEKATELHIRFASDLSSESLEASHLYVSRLEDSIRRDEASLKIAESERQVVHDQFLIAKRDREVLDKLKERKVDLHKRQRRVAEIAEIDEISTVKHGTRIPRGDIDG